ncbi:MAG TPA: glutathione-disulfide reductase [Xanthomonadaceae bacterium]|nr:glutathione-disulfide reductase [Xanthomonadaceae bacterium]
MAATSFDLIVIGAGSGGIAGAIRAAHHGARVAVVEVDALGGTCVNRGCVPKKAMWIAAHLAEAQADAVRAGFDSRPGRLDWSTFIALREAYIERIHASYRRRFEAAGIERVAGRGRLLGQGRVAVGERILQAGHILIATGARPHLPDLPGAALGEDSDEFFRWRHAPSRVALVGSGYIAVEFAGVLHALGCAVDVIARGPRLLGRFDADISDRLAAAMRVQGIGIHCEQQVQAIEGGAGAIRLRFADGGTQGPYERLVWALGRDPNVEELGLDSAGVALGADGHIAVDALQDTSAAGIHAVGDVTGHSQLTPVAIAAARRLMDRIFGGEVDARLDYRCIPTVVFGHPPVGVVGITEDEARAEFGASVEVHRGDFRPMRAALVDHGPRSFFKMVCAGADRRVVGLHLMGEGADEMLQGFAVAMRMGATKADFEATVAIHPTSAEEVVLL